MTTETKSPLLEERLAFWKEIQDNPRKAKVAARAKKVLDTAGDPASMDAGSLKSFRVELVEGLAALLTATDIAEVERPILVAPLEAKLGAIEDFLALRKPAK